MANFIGNFTKKGLSTLSKVVMQEEKLQIERAVVGKGFLPQDKTAYDITELVEPVDVQVHITNSKDLGEGKMAIMLRIQEVSQDFECREIGIIAKDKEGNEFLYQYANAGERASKILTDPNNPFYYDIVFITVLNTENEVSVNVDLDIGVSQEDFKEHKDNTNNPHNVTKSQIGLGNVTNDKQATSSELAALQNNLNGHKNSTSNPHNVTKSQIGLGNVTNDKQATSQQFNALVSQLNSGGVLTGTRNVNQLYPLHDFAGHGLFTKVEEAYFIYTLTDTDKTNKYISLHTIIDHIGYTGNHNNIAVLMISARTGEWETMCVIDSYGKCYVQDSDIYFDSSRSDIVYGTIRIVRHA